MIPDYIHKIMNQNVNDLGNKTEDKLEYIIDIMIKRKINEYCIQEIWKLQDFTLTIREHIHFHHGMNEKKHGITGRGVTIILGPELMKVWVRAEILCPLTSNSSSFFLAG